MGGECNQKDAHTKAKAVLNALGSHSKTLSHGCHINIEEARKLGLEIIALEDNKELQDVVLSVHHSFIVTLSATAAAAMTASKRCGVNRSRSLKMVEALRG